MEGWFDVDKEGLAKLLEGRSKAFIIFELLQNAWDTSATEVKVTLRPMPGRPLATLVVEDNDPDGFKDIRHAWTLFADSAKKADPEKRGRFNLGEKCVLALCDEASIRTTTGTVDFDARGRSTSRKRTGRGSTFTATVRMTRDELLEVERDVRTVLPPGGCATCFNGEQLASRPTLSSFQAILPTLVAGNDGVMRRTARKTVVDLYEVRDGEVAMLYEMGIPVVAIGDTFHVNVRQKVLLNADRDNVTPAYLRELRVAVLNEAHACIHGDAASASWVREAAGSHGASAEAVAHVMTERFGEKRVIADPSDPEGTKIAASQGYTVIPGGALSGGEWANVKAHGAALPAGQVTPSPKPYSPDGRDLIIVPRDRWTPGMARRAAFARRVGQRLIDADVLVTVADDPALKHGATFGPSGQLVLNLARLGHAWFARPNRDPKVVDLLIHELGHFYSSDHLSAGYHGALTDVGARMVELALLHPDLFEDDGGDDGRDA